MQQVNCVHNESVSWHHHLQHLRPCSIAVV